MTDLERSDRVDRIAAELEALTGPLIEGRRATYRAVLEDALANDAYACLPLPRDVFFGPAPDGERIVRGVMPHYSVFFGPMQYAVSRSGQALSAEGAPPARGTGPAHDAPPWRVAVLVAIEAIEAIEHPRAGGASRGRMELPDCELAGLEGDVVCRGTPYAQSGTTDACPASGEFSAPATLHNVRALLARWSREAEAYWNRDAAAFGLPVRYDFDFVLEDESAGRRVDLAVPLSTTCGRTPYFASMRSGWSLPILAHEIGHVLGLLDEYEALSGIVSFYPKTPFRGAEVSRMGLSMKESTRLLPIHHWLVLRRAFCSEPATHDPFAHALP